MIIAYDLIIIGGGPAGLSAAYTAKKYSLDYLVIERGRIADTISKYPIGKPLFSTTNELEFEPGTLHATGTKPTREELLDYYYRFVNEEQRLKIHTNEEVEAIEPGISLTIITTNACYRSLNIIMAVGGMGIFNQLGVPGETPERVSYLFREAAPFQNRKVVVVGGGNSAAEAALYLKEGGAQVTLVIRRASLEAESNSKGSAIKPWVREPLEEALKNGRITAFFSAHVVEITSNTLLLEAGGNHFELDCDHVFALIGTRPDVRLLSRAGAAIGTDGRPEYDRQTYETTISNLFVAGHLTRELHMKHALSIAPKIVELIARRLRG